MAMFPHFVDDRFDAFKARCLLAALDHNVHVDRQHAQQKRLVREDFTENTIKTHNSGPLQRSSSTRLTHTFHSLCTEYYCEKSKILDQYYRSH